MSKPIATEYRPHVCAFVDILGFSELVRSIPQKPARFDRILATLKELKARTQTPKHDDGSRCFHTRKVTAFSDSIVISYPILECGAARALCRDLVWLARSLLVQRILVRGAVAAGNLYDNEGIVFGDALIEAHRLESTVAIYPRIILQDAVLKADRWLKNAPALHSQLDDHEPMSIDRDADGVSFLNPLDSGFWSVDFPAPTSSSCFLKTVRKNFITLHEEAEAEKPRQPGTLAKLAWLANLFNRSLKKAKSYQEQVQEGQVVTNSTLPPRDEDFGSIESIECEDWVILPLAENGEASRHL
jgi:hypothetical protein